MKDQRIADLEGAYLGALGAVRETLGARSSLNIERAQRAQVNCGYLTPLAQQFRGVFPRDIRDVVLDSPSRHKIREFKVLEGPIGLPPIAVAVLMGA